MYGRDPGLAPGSRSLVPRERRRLPPPTNLSAVRACTTKGRWKSSWNLFSRRARGCIIVSRLALAPALSYRNRARSRARAVVKSYNFIFRARHTRARARTFRVALSRVAVDLEKRVRFWKEDATPPSRFSELPSRPRTCARARAHASTNNDTIPRYDAAPTKTRKRGDTRRNIVPTGGDRSAAAGRSRRRGRRRAGERAGKLDCDVVEPR